MRRFRTYRQLEHSDCGLTCVRMIARHYGKKIPLKELRRLSETSKLGVSVKDLTDAFAAVGMESAAVGITVADLYRMPLPAIVYWRQRHFVVLYHIDAKRKLFSVADPAEGKLKFTEEEFLRYWKGDADRGVAVVAEPGDRWDEISFPKPAIFPGLLKMVRSELTRHKGVFFKIILLSLLCMAADLLVPLMMQTTVDRGIAERDIGLVWMLVAGQLAVFLGNAASSNVLQYVMLRLGLAVNLDMTRRYLRRLIEFPLSFFDRKASSDLIQKIDDQARIKDFLLQLPQSTFFVILNLLVFSGLLIWYNPWLFLFFLVFTLGEIGWTSLFLRPRRGIDYSYFSQASENRNQVYELINGMTEIKTSGAQSKRLEVWENTQRKINSLSLRSALVSMAMGGGQSVIARIKEIAITGICATLVIKGELTFGEMLTVGYIVGRLAGPFHNIIAMISQVQDAAISYERLDEVLNDDTERQGTAPYSLPDIKFENVSFKYPGSASPFVIHDLSLHIEPGKTTAIVGESGCGKTTLIKLMLGFYVPQRGHLLLSETDVATLDRDRWMEHCAVVMQSGYLFSDSIAANIALGGDPDMERVKECIAIVGLDKFMETLPMGYNTRVGTTGLTLSGGQKQRLLIARALYRRPDILFLDEATSSLDAANERRITDRILELQRGKTLIVAAHRLSTVRNADRNLFMDGGRIIEEGTHDQLVARRGRYFALVSNQLELAR